MEVAVERPQPPVKEGEKRADAKPETIIPAIGSALPIVFESFQSSPPRTASIKQQDSSRLEAARAEMGEVREENERLKTMLSRIVSDYQTLQMRFLEARERASNNRPAKLTTLPAEAEEPAVAAADDDDLVSLSLGTRANNNGGVVHRKGHHRHERSSSSSGTADDDSQLSLGLGFVVGRTPNTGDDEKASDAGPVLNLSSDSSSADVVDTAKPAEPDRAVGSRKSPSGGGADDEVQQQAKKTRVSVRVKCEGNTMNDGCQWRKYGQKISKGNPCPRAYYRCTVAPNCPVRKQVQRCVEDKAILITTYEGTHNHQLSPAATAMASTTSAAAAMLTAGSTSSTSLRHHHHLPLASSVAAGLIGPTTMVSTAASCPTITLDLTAPAAANPHSLVHASPYAATGSYVSKALPAAWSSGYPAYGGTHQQLPWYGAAKQSSPAMAHHLFAAGLGVSSSSRPDQLFGGGLQPSSYHQLQRSTSLGGGQSAVAPVVTDTLAKAITSDPSFQSVLAAVITSYMGRGGNGGEAAQK